MTRCGALPVGGRPTYRAGRVRRLDMASGRMRTAVLTPVGIEIDHELNVTWAANQVQH